MPDFHCDWREPVAPLGHTWEHTVGSSHAAFALRADWQAQLRRCSRELGFRHVRFHALLSDPMDTLICENDELVYSFFNIDQIFDFLLSIGVKPFVELSFMPEALASRGKTVFHYRANVSPPRDLRQWGELLRKLARHWRDRYGAAEVRSWFFEVWNEPNLSVFGTGRRQDYFDLYRASVRAIKDVDAGFRVGGPATAASAWIGDFASFVDKHKLPADFISTHQYPTDAFGSPGDDTPTQLAKSRRGVMRQKAQDARRGAGGRPIYYTEWNTSSNPRDTLHDDPFAAAYATEIAIGMDDVVDGSSWWTFSDIFAENFMPAQPFEGGFGLLNINGVAKPVYRAFELLHRLGVRRLLVDGLHDTVSAWFVAGEDGDATLLLANHALPEQRIGREKVRFSLSNAPAPRDAWIERIDTEHANAPLAWRRMGSPPHLRERDVEALQRASELRREPVSCRHEDDVTRIEFELPAHAVAAVTIEFAAHRGSAFDATDV